MSFRVADCVTYRETWSVLCPLLLKIHYNPQSYVELRMSAAKVFFLKKSLRFQRLTVAQALWSQSSRCKVKHWHPEFFPPRKVVCHPAQWFPQLSAMLCCCCRDWVSGASSCSLLQVFYQICDAEALMLTLPLETYTLKLAFWLLCKIAPHKKPTVLLCVLQYLLFLIIWHVVLFEYLHFRVP